MLNLINSGRKSLNRRLKFLLSGEYDYSPQFKIIFLRVLQYGKCFLKLTTISNFVFCINL